MGNRSKRWAQKSLWPVYAFGAFIVIGFTLTVLGVRTCL
ncbi:hypothetical protein FB381_1103 [Nocardioides albertanoniae]|uniref:Uncharacterized protein n=1 Tax=Nocardioides albertanoniae TaxID=1175486 RepID=A0A543A3R3_9ACTN|nr:hypothetical protein FB381_1103 [Nocardioides albertanoniae]